MSFLVLSGQKYNQISRAVTAPTPESASALFPIANLSNGMPWRPFMFNTAGGSGYIDFDLQQILNGGFESWSGGAPVNWTVATVDTGTVTEETTIVNSGTSSVHLHTDGGVNDSASVSQTFTASAGEDLTIFWALYGTGGGPTQTIDLLLRNKDTGNYYSSGSWTSNDLPFANRSAASWLSSSTDIPVESYSTVLQDTTTLELIVRLTNLAPLNAYADDIVVVPQLNFVSLHGHNIPPWCGPLELRSGTSSPATTVRHTFTITQPTMFGAFASAEAKIKARYWRLFVTVDPPTDAIWIGEMVLGVSTTLTRAQNYGQELALIEPQSRHTNELGAFTAWGRSEKGYRRARVQFRLNDATDFGQMKEWLERSRNGLYPFVAVLETADAASAMLARVDPSWTHTRVTNTMRDMDLEIIELPFPVVIE